MEGSGPSGIGSVGTPTAPPKAESPVSQTGQDPHLDNLAKTIDELRGQVADQARADSGEFGSPPQANTEANNQGVLNSPTPGGENPPESPPNTVGGGQTEVNAAAKTAAPESPVIEPKQVDSADVESQKPAGQAINIPGQAEAKIGQPGESKPKEAASAEGESSTEAVPKIPGKVANDPGFKRIWGEFYTNARQQGAVDIARIDQQTLSEYYSKWAREQVEKGIPLETKSNPLYQQRLGETVIAVTDKGEPLDANKLSEQALAGYQLEKDLKEANLSEPQMQTVNKSSVIETGKGVTAGRVQ